MHGGRTLIELQNLWKALRNAMDENLSKEQQEVWDILKTPPMTRSEQIAAELKATLDRVNRVYNPKNINKRMNSVYGLK